MVEDEGPNGGASPPSDAGTGTTEAAETTEARRPPPAYEEVTLADLLDVLIRRKTLIAATFAVVLLASVVATAAMDPTYESTTTIVPTNERDTILSLLESRSFATDVAERLDLVDELGDGNATRAGQALASAVTVRQGTGQVGGEQKAILTITVQGPNPIAAWARATAWVSELEDQRGYLENVTWDKNWQKYYEQAGKDEQKAKRELTALVENMGYYQRLDPASVPSEPTSPDWRLNLSLGAVLGAMLALFLPFLVEGVQNALEERREGSETAAEDRDPP